MRSFKKSCCFSKNLTSRFFSVSKFDKGKYKYMILQNSPGSWTEQSIRDFLEDLKVKTEYVKQIQGELSGFKNNYIIKLITEVNEEDQDLVNAITNTNNSIKIVFTKEINAQSPKKGQNNIFLIVCKESNQLIKNEGFADFISKYNPRINYISGMTAAYIWINSEISLKHFKSLIESSNSLSSYQMDLHPTPIDQEDKKQHKRDVERLIIIDQRLTILSQTSQLINQNKEEILILQKERKRLRYSLKEIENLGHLKKYSIVGNSGTILYNH